MASNAARLFLSLVVLFVLVAFAHAGWQAVAPRLATILLDISCPANDTCYTTGASNGYGSLILMSNDGGLNWTNQNPSPTDSLTFLSLDMLNTQDGFTSGLSLGKMEGALYTTNGMNWTESTTKHLLGAFQDVGEIDVNTLWQVGQWESFKVNGDGVQISTDGGVTFGSYSWNQVYDARYGSFISSQVGWISGGNFPESGNSTADVHHMNQHLSFNKKTGKFDIHKPVSGQASEPNNTFGAVIASTTDGGNTWTTLYTNNGGAEFGFYFNQIWFTDANNGWVVGEGVNATTEQPYAFVWGTTDGGQNWNQQLYVSGASFIQMEMLTPTFGWVVGGTNLGELSMEGVFYQTTDGSTWNLVQSLKYTYQTAVSIVDENYAYSAGLDIEEVSGVYAYTA